MGEAFAGRHSELETVHAARHGKIGEDKVRIHTALQHGKRGIGIAGFDGLIAEITQRFRQSAAHHSVVIDDEYGFTPPGVLGHRRLGGGIAMLCQADVAQQVIPNLVDHDLYGQSRSPMDMMRQG